MTNIRRTLSGAMVLAALFMFAMAGTAAASKPNPDHKVTLCHRTGSATNPYVEITVDIASVANAKDARGHDDHDQIGNGLGGDIIPAYTYVGKDGTFFYPGKNLDTIIGGETGRTILANGCKLTNDESTPTPTPTGTPTATPSATPSASPSGTPTASGTPAPSGSPTTPLTKRSTGVPNTAFAPAPVNAANSPLTLIGIGLLLLAGAALTARRIVR